MSSNDDSKTTQPLLSGWALILGSSSGFGEATSIRLAQAGMNIFGVHLDRRASMPNVERIQDDIRAAGREAIFFNANAADSETRAMVCAEIRKKIGDDKIKVLLHSLAFGTLKPFLGKTREDSVSQKQLEMTLDVMGTSLVYWVQDLFFDGLLGAGSRVFAMTSTGSWQMFPDYGPVGAAKSVLEFYIRALATELSPHGATANAICAGVTDTPALRKIPAAERMLEIARRKNPGRRGTEPKDIANAIVALSRPETQWMTGNVIFVDGGEAQMG